MRRRERLGHELIIRECALTVCSSALGEHSVGGGIVDGTQERVALFFAS
jgi:hypothetical protein